jgi:hypothetical protein
MRSVPDWPVFESAGDVTQRGTWTRHRRLVRYACCCVAARPASALLRAVVLRRGRCRSGCSTAARRQLGCDGGARAGCGAAAVPRAHRQQHAAASPSSGRGSRSWVQHDAKPSPSRAQSARRCAVSFTLAHRRTRQHRRVQPLGVRHGMTCLPASSRHRSARKRAWARQREMKLPLAGPSDVPGDPTQRGSRSRRSIPSALHRAEAPAAERMRRSLRDARRRRDPAHSAPPSQT